MVCRANSDTVCTVTLATYQLTAVWELPRFSQQYGWGFRECRANSDTVCTVTLATYQLTPVWELPRFSQQCGWGFRECRANSDTVCTVTLATYQLTPVWELPRFSQQCGWGFRSSGIRRWLSTPHQIGWRHCCLSQNSCTDHPVTQRHIPEKRNPQIFMGWATHYISEAFLFDTSIRNPAYTIRGFPGIKQPERWAYHSPISMAEV